MNGLAQVSCCTTYTIETDKIAHLLILYLSVEQGILSQSMLMLLC